MTAPTDKSAIRAAATIVLVRPDGEGHAVLMGQRGANAAFMASKFVFPGGAVDPADADACLSQPLSPECSARIARSNHDPRALAAAAIRELAEETGLLLGRPGTFANPSDSWAPFTRAGLIPDASSLRLIFRAVTPPGRKRRFDAFFFLADGARVIGDHHDFANADGELTNLHWVPLSHARALPIPFITEVVLSEVEARFRGDDIPDSVPFYDNTTSTAQFLRID